MADTQACIALGSVSAPPDLPYPRLLVTRRWPRGIEPGAIDQWEPDFAPSAALAEAYRSGTIAWDEFAARYRAEIEAQPALLDWAARMATSNGVVLLCSAPDGERCHRDVLAELLHERIPASGASD